MPVTLTIKNAPDELVDAVRARAAANHRSIEGEVLAIMEASVRPARRMSIEELTAEIEKLGIRGKSESAAMIREDRDSDDR